MQRVGSLDEYYELINGEKSKYGRLKTNNYMFPDDINRYIGLERLYVEFQDNGIIFLTDEEDYWQAYYHLSDAEFGLDLSDKPVLIQNIYRENKKNDYLKELDRSLETNGFIKADMMRHAQLDDPQKTLNDLLPAEGISLRIMNRQGLTMSAVGEGQLEALKRFRENIKEIPFYQQPYFTNDELMKDSEKGLLTCITDASGQIKAARHLIMQGNKSYGWIGVAEEYKGVYGLASIMMIDQLRLICNEGIIMCSWVESNNTASLQYHERLGSRWSGSVMDEWILYEC